MARETRLATAQPDTSLQFSHACRHNGRKTGRNEPSIRWQM